MAESQVSAEIIDQPTSAPESSPQNFQERARERLQRESNDQPAPEDELDNEAESLSEDTTDDEADQLDYDETETDSDDEQPDEEELARVFEVDGEEFSPDDIRNLVSDRKKWDVEFRRRTQNTADLQRKYQNAGQELAVQQHMIMDAHVAQLNQLKNYDPAQMTQEQYTNWQGAMKSAQDNHDYWANNFSSANAKLKDQAKAFEDAKAAESIEVLQGIEPRWSEGFYGELRDFAEQTGRYSKEEFNSIVDWRQVEGLVALFDRDKASSGLSNAKESKSKPNRRRQKARQRNRNAQGQFQSARDAMFNSPSPKKDGTFREMMRAKLEAERSS